MDETLIYDSARRGHPAIEELREAINYRYLIWQLVRRDVLTRYKRSVLGVAWTLLNPLGMMLVLTLAFSHIFRFNTDSYAAYVLSGLLAWTFFSQTTTAAMVNLVWGGGLLNRIYIPRASFALAAIGTGLVNLALALIPMLIVMLITRMPIHISLIFLPIPMLLLACFSLGVGLFTREIAIINHYLKSHASSGKAISIAYLLWSLSLVGRVFTSSDSIAIHVGAWLVDILEKV